MAQLLIRRLDDDIVARLREKAKRQGVSLEQFLRDVVTREAGPSKEDYLEGLTRLRESIGPVNPALVQAELAEARRERDERPPVQSSS